MSSDRQDIVTKVLQSVIELPVEEREAFLAETCAEDPALRSEVEALLRARDQADKNAEPRPSKEAAAVTEEKGQPATMVGRHIGPYRIERQIGQGGMGTVYLAVRDDREFQKQVVVKLVKRGMDSQDLIRRFRVERQILAYLDRPIGGVFVSWASDPKTPAEQQGQQWREARSTYEKSLAIWQGMAQRGQLKESQQQKIKEASAAIAKCDAALHNKSFH